VGLDQALPTDSHLQQSAPPSCRPWPVGERAAGCAGISTGNQTVPTSTASVPALLVYRDGVGSFGLYRGDGPIVALDPKNGRLLWQRDPLPPGASIVSPLLQPTVQDGLIYVPASYRDPSATSYHAALEALDAVTGQRRWRHEVAPQQDGNPGLDSAPVVANGIAYLASTVSAKGQTQGQTHTLTGLVEALDSHSGAVRWSAPMKDATTAPAVADGHAIVLAGQDLVALNTTDGSVAWTFTPPGGSFFAMQSGVPPIAPYRVTEGYPAPFVAQRLVFVEATEADGAGTGIGSTWFAVKTSDGSLAWRSARSAPGIGFTRPVLNQSGTVLCTTGHASDSGDFVMGLSPTDGKTLWKMSTTAKLSVCAASGDNFYLTQSNQNQTAGGMLALNDQTGQQLWYTPTKPPVLVSGVEAPPQRDGLAVVYSPGPIPTATDANPIIDTIAIVQVSTGNILWRQDIHGLQDIEVKIIGDHVLVPEYSLKSSTLAPMLVAYTLHTGSRTWAYTFGHA
jgi:outer membrane protein assembly factor BamB